MTLKKTMEGLNKAVRLILSGYGAWIAYRILRYARSYVQTPQAITKITSPLSAREIQSLMQSFQRQFQPTSDKALAAHLYYTDLLSEILNLPLVQSKTVDLFITVGPHVDEVFFKNLEPYRGRVFVQQFSNRGRDVYPFLKLLPQLGRYSWVCKVHGKRSPQIRDGELWRKDLFADLFSPQTLSCISSAPIETMIWASPRSLLPLDLFMAANGPRLREILSQLHIPEPPPKTLFVAGTMFWFRPTALQMLLKLPNLDEVFEPESAKIDGLTAHAFERLFYYLATRKPTSSIESSQSKRSSLGTN